jgi:hypothetical protein
MALRQIAQALRSPKKAYGGMHKNGSFRCDTPALFYFLLDKQWRCRVL